jgi:selenoprotein W-related protein
MGQELLSTFAEELGEVALAPGSGGVFQIRVNDELIWDRADRGGFPDIKELKQLVRDRVAPQKGLGHSDSNA